MAIALSSTYLEGALFHAYHALESVACAAIVSAGLLPPKPHQRKLLAFDRVFGRRFPQFAILVSTLSPMRNQTLYPVYSGGTWYPPRTYLADTAANLPSRASGLVTAIIQGLSL